MAELNGEQMKLNGLDITTQSGILICVATHAIINKHVVATSMINTSDELSTPVKRDSYIVDKIGIDGMGRILLRDVPIESHCLTRLMFECSHDERCTRRPPHALHGAIGTIQLDLPFSCRFPAQVPFDSLKGRYFHDAFPCDDLERFKFILQRN
jgi:hypothetical protein